MEGVSVVQLQRRQKALSAYVEGKAKLATLPSPEQIIRESFGAEPDPWQKRFLRAATSRTAIAIVACRQTGKSTVEAAFIGWCMLAYPGFTVLACSRSLRQAALLLSKIKEVLFTYVPRDYAVHANSLGVVLQNGSQAIAVPCQGADAARGFSPDLLAMDEAAFIPDDVHIALTPSLAATGGAFHMISSPNGRAGTFFEAVEGKSSSDFLSFRVRADEIDRFDPEYLERQKRLLGDMPYRQEYLAEFITLEGAFFNAETTEIIFEGQELDEGSMTTAEYVDIFEAQMADMAVAIEGSMRRPGRLHG